MPILWPLSAPGSRQGYRRPQLVRVVFDRAGRRDQERRGDAYLWAAHPLGINVHPGRRQAFAEGKVELPNVNLKAANVPHRLAPSFKTIANKSSRENLSKAYTVETLAKFLRWNLSKVENVLSVLTLIEEGLCKGIDFTNLTPKQAQW